MAKDLGTKHSCFKCSTKFYDLKKPEPVCPKCGTDQREAPSPKALAAAERRQRAAAREVEPEAVDTVAAPSEEEEEPEVPETEEAVEEPEEDLGL